MAEEEFDKIEEGTDNFAQLLSGWTYNKEDYSEKEDEHNFIIPRILVQNGRSLAQIRNRPKGLYKDVARSPFIRKTGFIGEDGKIPDFDISNLVWYGTLQQAKIAPTLENLDIRLYIREPNLKKVPDLENTENPYADEYIWREVHPGFHTYNNEIVYGYEWLVLQDDYSTEDGIYNLRMNIEDGLGLCKFAGSQSPISLKGVQFKLLVVRRNLWDREFSLEESMPLASNLDLSSDTLSPTVNAVKNYYRKAVETAKVVTQYLSVGEVEKGEPWFEIKDGEIVIKAPVQLQDIKNLYEFLKETSHTCNEHSKSEITNAAKNQDGSLVEPHGISNKGFLGNLNAKELAGAILSNGQQGITQDVEKGSYIPFVSPQDTMGIGNSLSYYERSSGQNPKEVYNLKIVDGSVIESIPQSEVEVFQKSLMAGSTVLTYKITQGNSLVQVELSGGTNDKVPVQIKADYLDIKGLTIDGQAVTESVKTSLFGSSTIAYKEVYSELLGIKLKEAGYSVLTPNTSKDVNGEEVGDLDTESLEIKLKALTTATEEDEKAWQKLGSALQALYELPLATFVYKRGKEEYKTQLGVLVERVNQIRDTIETLRGQGQDDLGHPTEDNYLVHKRNSKIKSKNEKVLENTEGLEISGSNYSELNSYTYSEEEIKSIAKYLDLVTSKKELAQELRNTVGILLVAAKETQTRLLDLETSVYGIDSPTLPGETDDQAFKDKYIHKDLQGIINASPLFLGLNRLVKALSLEIFDTTDLEKIDAEFESRVTDSDTLGSKVSIKSRIDQVDEITNELWAQVSALVQLLGNQPKNYSRILKEGLPLSESFHNGENPNLLETLGEECGEESFVDEGRQWKTLPSLSESALDESERPGYLEVFEHYNKHTPTKEECSTILEPEILNGEGDSNRKLAHEDESQWTGEGSTPETNAVKTNRVWSQIKIDKYKSDEIDEFSADGTYQPYLKEQVVASDSAKLERLNKKVSEITKNLYSVDEVIAKYPNRLETIRRNITNLVDDLYPNRLFSVESLVMLDGLNLYRPFKESFNKDVKSPIEKVLKGEPLFLSDCTPDLNSDEEVVELEGEGGTKVGSYYPTRKNLPSLLYYLNNQIFNFSFESNFLPVNLNGALVDNQQLSFENNSFKLSTAKLVTLKDISVFTENENVKINDLGTYNKAISKIDILSEIIGLKDSWIPSLVSSTGSISSELNSSVDEWSSSRNTIFLNELKWPSDGWNITDGSEDKEPSSSIKESTKPYYYLSRKEKSLQNRITTLEAFSDSLARYLNAIPNEDGEVATKKGEVPLKRFEALETETKLKRLALMSEREAQLHRILDLDLSGDWGSGKEPSESEAIKVIQEHNDKVFQTLLISKDIRKSFFTKEEGVTGYTITGELAESPELLDSVDYLQTSLTSGSEYEAGGPYRNLTWKIQVSYVDSIPSGDLSKNTIYLKAKSPIEVEQTGNFIEDGETPDTDISNPSRLLDAKGWQNQTEYNIYKTMNNLFMSMFPKKDSNTGIPENVKESGDVKTLYPLYYQNMLNAHPVHSLYMSNKGTDPGLIFGGTWTQIKGRFIVGAGPVEGLTNDSVPGDLNPDFGENQFGGFAQIQLTKEQMPEHNHIIGQQEIKGKLTFEDTMSVDQTESGSTFTKEADFTATLPELNTNPVGGGQPFNNLPPWASKYIWERTGD